MLTDSCEIGHAIPEAYFVEGATRLLNSHYGGSAPVSNKPLSVGTVGGARIIRDSSQPTRVRYEKIPDDLKVELNEYLQGLKNTRI